MLGGLPARRRIKKNAGRIVHSRHSKIALPRQITEHVPPRLDRYIKQAYLVKKILGRLPRRQMKSSFRILLNRKLLTLSNTALNLAKLEDATEAAQPFGKSGILDSRGRPCLAFLCCCCTYPVGVKRLRRARESAVSRLRRPFRSLVETSTSAIRRYELTNLELARLFVSAKLRGRGYHCWRNLRRRTASAGLLNKRSFLS